MADTRTVRLCAVEVRYACVEGSYAARRRVRPPQSIGGRARTQGRGQCARNSERQRDGGSGTILHTAYYTIFAAACSSLRRIFPRRGNGNI